MAQRAFQGEVNAAERSWKGHVQAPRTFAEELVQARRATEREAAERQAEELLDDDARTALEKSRAAARKSWHKAQARKRGELEFELSLEGLNEASYAGPAYPPPAFGQTSLPSGPASGAGRNPRPATPMEQDEEESSDEDGPPPVYRF